MIFLTSDLHIGHNKDFLYTPRGFTNIEDHDRTLIDNWNNVVGKDDIVYILGDIMLNDNDHGIEVFNQLNGYKKIILGNHDTAARVELYSKQPNTVILGFADMLKYKSDSGRTYNFYLSHYPTFTANFDDNEKLSQIVLNLYGHTHQKENFYNNSNYMYHVGMDSHNNKPVEIEEIIKDIKDKIGIINN